MCGSRFEFACGTHSQFLDSSAESRFVEECAWGSGCSEALVHFQALPLVRCRCFLSPYPLRGFGVDTATPSGRLLARTCSCQAAGSNCPMLCVGCSGVHWCLLCVTGGVTSVCARAGEASVGRGRGVCDTGAFAAAETRAFAIAATPAFGATGHTCVCSSGCTCVCLCVCSSGHTCVCLGVWSSGHACVWHGGYTCVARASSSASTPVRAAQRAPLRSVLADTRAWPLAIARKWRWYGRLLRAAGGRIHERSHERTTQAGVYTSVQGLRIHRRSH